MKARKDKRLSTQCCSSLAEGTRGRFFFYLALLKDPVLFSSVSAGGSTPPRRKSFDLEAVLSPASKSGSTPRGSCNVTSICSNVEKASNRESDDSVGAATRPLSEMMVRPGVRASSAEKASDLADARESSGIIFGDRTLCHRAHLSAPVSASLPSSVVGRGEGRVTGRARAACQAGQVSALCCPCSGLDLVGGNDNICGECLSRALGDGPWNSCVEHGEGQGAGHVHGAAGETKPKSTSTRSGVWRPLEGLMPVSEELASDPRGASEELHVETREGRTCTTLCGTRLVELGKGCGVEVRIPCVPEMGPYVAWTRGLTEGNVGLETSSSHSLQVGCGFSLVL